MAKRRPVGQAGQAPQSGLPLGLGDAGCHLNPRGDPLAQRGEFGRRTPAVDLRVQVSEQPDRSEDCPRPCLSVAKQRHPLHPLKHNSVPAADFHQLQCRGRRQSGGMDRARGRVFALRRGAGKPAVIQFENTPFTPVIDIGAKSLADEHCRLQLSCVALHAVSSASGTCPTLPSNHARPCTILTRRVSPSQPPPAAGAPS